MGIRKKKLKKRAILIEISLLQAEEYLKIYRRKYLNNKSILDFCLATAELVFETFNDFNYTIIYIIQGFANYIIRILKGFANYIIRILKGFAYCIIRILKGFAYYIIRILKG